MDKTFRNIDVCKTSRNGDTMMFYQFNTYIAIIHIIVLTISIALRLATININSYDTSKALNRIASELETANQIRIVENCMDCDCDLDEEEEELDTDSNTDNETQTSETSNSKTIGELAAEASLASDTKLVAETYADFTSNISPAAMESKSEEDSIESAHA